MTPANSATVSMIIGQPTSAHPGERAGSERERGSESNGAFERVFASGHDDEAARPEERDSASGPSEDRQAEVGDRRVERHAAALQSFDTQDAAYKTLSDPAIPALPLETTKGADAQAADRPVQASAVASASLAAGAIDPTPGATSAPRAVAVSIETAGPATINRPAEPLGAVHVVETTTEPAAVPRAGQAVAAANATASVSVQPRAAEALPAASPPVAGAAVEGEPVAPESASRPVTQDGASAAKVTVSVAVQPRAANAPPQAPQSPQPAGAEAEATRAGSDSVDEGEPPVGPRAPAEPFKLSSAAKALAAGLGQRNAVGQNPAALQLGEAAGSEIDVSAPTDSAQAARATGSRPVSAAVGAVAIQIHNQVEILANGRTVHVRLDPPNLGSFEVRLELSGTAVHAVVASDRADTLELLARHRNELITILADAGFDVLDARFEGGGESPSDLEDEELLSVGSPADTDEAALSPSHWIPSSWVDSSGRLDIRA